MSTRVVSSRVVAFYAGVILILVGLMAAKPSDDSQNFEPLINQFLGAWERADAPALSRLFEEQADLMIPQGMLIEGQSAIAQFYAGAFERGYRGSRAAASMEHVRTLADGLVVIDGKWSIEGAMSDGKPAPSERGVFTLIARRGTSGWRIAALREQASAIAVTRFTPSGAR